MKKIYRPSSFIDGQFVPDSSNKILVRNKFSQDVLEEISLLEKSMITDLIKSSVDAFHCFKNSSLEQRANILNKLKKTVEDNAEDLALLICLEAGKPLSYAKAEIQRCIQTIEIGEKETLELKEFPIDINLGAGAHKNAKCKRFPVGPVLGISPFNFPLNLALHKIVPAIASGCSIVIKPSPFAPLSLLAFANLTKDCLPAGLLNIVICDDESSEMLVKSDSFKLLSFTGSSKIGWMLKSKAEKKKVVLELGGDAAVIIDQKQDLESIASSVAMGSFLYAGQICISTQRIFIHESEFDCFLKFLIGKTNDLKVGDPIDLETIVGPVISHEHLNRIDEWVKEAKDKGANIHLGGKIVSGHNNLYAPTILSNVTSEMIIGKEEVFGPVVIVHQYKSFEEAIELVNSSKYGLQCGLFSNDSQNIEAAFRKIEVGGLIVNGVPGFRVDSMPYGGVKDSGLGREGIKYAIEDMTELRLLVF